MGGFSEAEYGKLLQEAIEWVRSEQRQQKGKKLPNLINVTDAARVVVRFYEHMVHPPKEYKERVCPNDIEEHVEYPFTCHCFITPEMIANIMEIIEEERHPCPHCGRPAGSGTYHPRHEEMHMSGHRVWGTVWHGPRDH